MKIGFCDMSERYSPDYRHAQKETREMLKEYAEVRCAFKNADDTWQDIE